MNIRAKLNARKDALSRFYLNKPDGHNGRFASQANAVVGLGVEMLGLIPGKILPPTLESEIARENEIDIIFTGSLIYALSQNNFKYRNRDFTPNKSTAISMDPQDKFYNQPMCRYVPGELYEICEIAKLMGVIEENDPTLKYVSLENREYTNMILAIGTKAMNGELEFDAEKMTAIFPELKSQFEDVCKRIIKKDAEAKDDNTNKPAAFKSLFLTEGFKNKNLYIRDKYNRSLDAQATMYTELFSETRALFKCGDQGRKLFANTRAWYNGAGKLFANTHALLKGQRPFFANTRAALGKLSVEDLKELDKEVNEPKLSK